MHVDNVAARKKVKDLSDISTNSEKVTKCLGLLDSRV